MTNDETILSGKKHLHFIGIGGSGMFPLVQILHSEGFHITGSDNNLTDTVNYEREVLGISITIGHSPENLKGADLIVYTAAISKDNVELAAALSSGVTCWERSILLGEITKRYDNCICVSGTHGKTTVTSMITQILFGAGLDPTAVIGGKLKAIQGGGRSGKSDIMVCEACEFVDTFLKLSPDIAVVLNVDEDHLDYFGSLENIITSFRKFAELTTKVLIVNGSDENTKKVMVGLTKPIVTFGWDDSCDYWPANICYNKGLHTEFDLMHHGELLQHIELQVPGRHNILNACAACAAALYVGATPKQLCEHLWHFGGAGRRFELIGKVNGITFVDDYAHHPRELEVTLSTAMEMGFHHVWAVFQPFTYSRTALLKNDFISALRIADHVVMSEIMGGRENNTYNIYTKDLAEHISNSVWFHSFSEIANYVLKNATDGDLVITLGCGDINKCAHLMVSGHELVAIDK